MASEFLRVKPINNLYRRTLQNGLWLQSATRRAWAKVLLQAGLLFVVFGVGMAVIQFSSPDLPDNDGYYHIKLAEIMRQEGLRPDFPWLPLTILNQREFYDHHFLFHVALIPFTLGDLRLGAKLASVVFASAAFVCVWWLLRGQKVRYAALWALGILVVSEAFLYRMSITRAQSLSLGLLALSLHWMLQGRTRLFILVGFVYVWLYNAFPLLLLLAGLYALAVLLVERRLAVKPLMYAGLGILAGLVINPYFPQDIIFATRHILPKALEATAVRVGNEWYPYTTAQLLENSLPALLLTGLGLLSLGLAGRRMTTASATALLSVFLFAWMTFEARRFIEYLPAFGLVFAALAFQSLLGPGGWLAETLSAVPARVQRALMPRMDVLGIAAALLLLGIGIWRTLPEAASSVQNAKPYATYAQASAWLADNTPAGERVFQTDWDDFPRLFFYNTHNTYLVGLDPTYMQLYNSGLYDDWVAITRGKVERPSGEITSKFAARYVLSDLKHSAFLRLAEDDPGMQEVYRDQYAVIFHIDS